MFVFLALSILYPNDYQSIERNMSVSKNIDIIPQCEGCLMHVASFLQQAQAQQGCALVDIFMWC